MYNASQWTYTAADWPAATASTVEYDGCSFQGCIRAHEHSSAPFNMYQAGYTCRSQQGAATPGPAAQPQVENFDSSFNWLSYWYPVQVLASADPSRPHAIELLGKQLVLWRDGEGSWRCMEDLCPHRYVPVSVQPQKALQVTLYS